MRALLTKFPGHFFTAYQTAQFFSQLIITAEQYVLLLNDFFTLHEGSRERFYKNVVQAFNFTNDIPKYKLFVKLQDGIK